MISHLQMITVFVSDMDRALAFYTEKLDFVKLYDDHEARFVDSDGNEFLLHS